MNLFKQRKNKSFSYTPRQRREQEQTQKEDITSQWKAVRGSAKRKRRIFSNLPVMLLFLIAVLILLYIISGYQ